MYEFNVIEWLRSARPTAMPIWLTIASGSSCQNFCLGSMAIGFAGSKSRVYLKCHEVVWLANTELRGFDVVSLTSASVVMATPFQKLRSASLRILVFMIRGGDFGWCEGDRCFAMSPPPPKHISTVKVPLEDLLPRGAKACNDFRQNMDATTSVLETYKKHTQLYQE